MPIDPQVILALAAVAFIAGYVDAVAGGGGLLTVPALLLAGVPPVEAIATNKLQSTFGVATASHTYWRAGHVDLGALAPLVALTAIGALTGSLLVSKLDPSWLRILVPAILVAIAAYFTFAPSLEPAPDAKALPPLALGAAIALPVGAYDGFLGPGAGSLYLAGLIGLGGFGLLRGAAATKVLNLTSNAVALAIFLGGGKVLFPVGLPMALGQIAGGWLGAHSALRFGSKLIRPLVVVMSVSMALRLLLGAGGPLRHVVGWP